MDTSDYSADPYEDGTVPADADFATSGADGAAKESDPDDDSSADGDSNRDALVDGNRVATAGDME